MKKDLTINRYTQVFDYYDTSSTTNYYTNNPGAWLTPELSFPQDIEFCLDRYYASDEDVYKKMIIRNIPKCIIFALERIIVK